MGLDNDSDEEALAEMPMVDCKRARGVKNKPAPRAELTTISFRGMEMTVKVREKGRGIAVPLEGASLSTILRHLREQVLAGDAPLWRLPSACGGCRPWRCRPICDGRSLTVPIRSSTQTRRGKTSHEQRSEGPAEGCPGTPVVWSGMSEGAMRSAAQSASLVELEDKSSCARYEVSRVS